MLNMLKEEDAPSGRNNGVHHYPQCNQSQALSTSLPFAKLILQSTLTYLTLQPAHASTAVYSSLATQSLLSMSSMRFAQFASRLQSRQLLRLAPQATRGPVSARAIPAWTTTPRAFTTSTNVLADKDGQEAASDPHHEESFEEFTARYDERVLVPGIAIQCSCHPCTS